MEADRWLSALFLGDIPPVLRPQFESLIEPDLETLLEAAFETGRLAWPGVQLDAAHFVRKLADVLDDLEGPPAEALGGLHAADLYLACACAFGEPSAVATLERDFIGKLDAPLRGTGLDVHAADDVKQRVRELVLVGTDGVPVIANYRGRGQLRSWLRAVALRQAMMHFRARKEIPMGDDALAAVPGFADDPQLAPLKAKYAAAFRGAFEHAIGTLDEQQRNLLRQHHLDRLSIDALASLHRVHRATAARRVAAAREALLAAVRAHVVDQLAISGGELDSALRMARSQLDVSMHRLLGAKRVRKS